jgi:hypothetical protein
MKQGWVMCCSFVISFLCVWGVRYFSTVLPNSYLWKQGLSDVLLFLWFLSLCLVLGIFNSPAISTYESRDWVMCCSLWFLSLCLVLEYFQQSYPISTYESRDWVMCCSFLIPFFVFGLKSIFQQSYPFLPMKAGIGDVLLFVILWVWS